MNTSMSSPVANGAAIDTATFGNKSFSVTATDVAGNSITVPANYTVLFASAGIVGVNADGSSTFTRPATIPLSFQLTTSTGGWYTYTGSNRPHLWLAKQEGRRHVGRRAGGRQDPIRPPPMGTGSPIPQARTCTRSTI